MKQTLKILGGVMIGALILFGAVGCLKESSEKALKKMIQAMANVDSVYPEIKLWVNGQFPQLTSFNFDEAKFYPGTIILDLKGDLGLKKNTEFDLSGSGKYRLLDSEIEFDGELIYQAGLLYLKLTKVPELKLVDLAALKNIWYKFDFAALGLASSLSKTEEKLNEKKNKELRNLVEATDFFDVLADEGIDTVNFEESRRFRVKLNQQNLSKFMEQATEIMEEREIDDAEKEALKNNLAKLNDVEFRIWVGRDDYRLYRIEFGLTTETKERGAMRYDVALNFSGYNKVVNIEKPQDVRDFNMLEIFAGGEVEAGE